MWKLRNAKLEKFRTQFKSTCLTKPDMKLSDNPVPASCPLQVVFLRSFQIIEKTMYRVVQKGWKHLFSLPQKNYSWDLHNIKDTCASLHGNFFGMHLIGASNVLLQSREHNTKYLFFYLLTVL